jgi:hypothetical protein
MVTNGNARSKTGPHVQNGQRSDLSVQARRIATALELNVVKRQEISKRPDIARERTFYAPLPATLGPKTIHTVRVCGLMIDAMLLSGVPISQYIIHSPTS